MATNETEERETVELSDFAEVEVADVPEESRTIATGITVSASEKVQVEQYEPYEPHASIRAKFVPAIDLSHPTGRQVVRDRALELHRDIQEGLAKATENRLADPDFEDWPDDLREN